MSDIELTAKQRAKIKRCLKGLEQVRVEIQKANPNEIVHWYLEDTANLNLMCGHTHEDKWPQRAIQENIIEQFDMPESSGGGW